EAQRLGLACHADRSLPGGLRLPAAELHDPALGNHDADAHGPLGLERLAVALRSLGALAHVELVEDVADVRLHGPRGDDERGRDLLVGEAVGEHAQDVVLARAEALDDATAAAAALARGLHEVAHRPSREAP